jgi:Ca-activated chloride channel family protein
MLRHRSVKAEGTTVGKRSIVCLGLGFILAAGWVRAGEDSDEARVAITPRIKARPQAAINAAIRVDTKLVLIPVTVTDTYGAPFSGLTREGFRLFEDGVEQNVKYFAAEEAPVSLGIVFDASRSMEGKLDQSRAAVSRFLRGSRPGDEYFLVEFNDRPRLLTGFTGDTDVIEKSLVGIKPKNWTALLDAVYMAIHQMKHAGNSHKALLILSDGGDNNSRYTESEIRSRVREADVSIYSIGLGTGLIRRHVRLLKQLSEETGGEYRQADKMSDLPDAVERISAAIRHQYLLGYSSSNGVNDGLFRKIKVTVSQPSDKPPLHASWRTGYYAPADR